MCFDDDVWDCVRTQNLQLVRCQSNNHGLGFCIQINDIHLAVGLIGRRQMITDFACLHIQ